VPKIALSDAGLRSLQPPPKGQTDYWDTSFKAGAFGCRVSQGGTKTFLIKRRNRRITIGQFPTISLADARSEAKRLLAELTLGKSHPHALAYDKAVALFVEDKARAKKPRTVADYKRLLGRLRFGGQLTDITHDEALRVLNRFKAPGEREHLRVAAKVFFNWCRKRRYIDHNPVDGLAITKSTPRARVLTDAELQSIWRACEQTGEYNLADEQGKANECAAPRLPAHFATIVRLLMLTGMRRGECAAIQGSWIQNDVLVLPSSLTKNGREHHLPLPGSALTLLKNFPADGLLFPARGSTTTPFNGWSKSKAALDEISGVTDWCLHDARRTFATRLAELGVAPHVIERLLNHTTGTISGVAAVYNRAKYLEEMRAAVELWDAHLQQILEVK